MRRQGVFIVGCAAALLARPGTAAPARRPARAAAAAATRLQSLVAFPTAVRLRGRGEGQQLVLTGARGSALPDVTGTAAYRVSRPGVVAVSPGGLVTALADGEAVIAASCGGAVVRVPVSVRDCGREPAVSFVHDVEPLLSRAGCNQGGCHGKATGQNGFRLSLFGFDPQFDYDALVRDGRGRRIALDRPEQSLLLRKAAADLPHGGGKRFTPGSPAHRLLARWIAQGAPYDPGGRPSIARLEIFPGERLLAPGSPQQVAVTAHFDDGSSRDVTREALFRSNDEAVASVDEQGRVRAGKQPGEAAVMAGYMGQVAVFRPAVPLGASPVPAGAFPPNNYVDEHVGRKLRQLGIPPSDLCTDAEFIRRASLDLCGRLPTPDEVRGFLKECQAERESVGVWVDGCVGVEKPAPVAAPPLSPAAKAASGLVKRSPLPGRTPPTHPHTHTPTPSRAETPASKTRATLVDRLLDDPDYAAFFALKWSGILRNTGQYRAAAVAFHSWIREALAANMPYDRFAREIVAAQGEWEENPPVAWFWQFRDGGTPELVDDVAQLFLGVRMQCARCHHHPYERWGQDDYYGLAGFFTRMGRKIIREPGYYYASRRTTDGLTNPRTGKPVVARLLDGTEPKVAPGEDPRQKLVDWMVVPSNPFFAPTIANRLWAHFFGRGLVDPLDDMRITNPPSNPELLQALSRDLVEHKYDLKHLIRTIVTSRTYQLSSTPNRYNGADRQHYARYYPKRLLAEVLLDAVDHLTGTPTRFNGVSSRARAVDLPHEEFPSYFLDVFGRPKQLSSPCECVRDPGANLSQVLHLVNSPDLDGKIASGNGRAAALAKADRPLPEKIEELYFWAFCRPPEPDEARKALEYVSGEKEQQKAFEELIWTFINCREFQFNH